MIQSLKFDLIWHEIIQPTWKMYPFKNTDRLIAEIFKRLGLFINKFCVCCRRSDKLAFLDLDEPNQESILDFPLQP